jgi:hypothetical protein
VSAGRAAHAFAGCGIAVTVAAAVALATGSPWLFPSLGPTAMLQTEQPTSDGSTPRNTLIGHVVALAAGYLSLVAFGLAGAPSTIAAGVGPRRIGAAAMSLAVTAAVLLLVRRPHAPAGATTLIVSLGLVRTPGGLAVMLGSVALVTACCLVYNRSTGAPMPIWHTVPPARRGRLTRGDPDRPGAAGAAR